VTEADWLACTDPQWMLNRLHGRASDRKFRLFAVACCTRLWHWFEDERSRQAVLAAERFADGRCSAADLAGAREVAWAAVRGKGWHLAREVGQATASRAATLTAYLARSFVGADRSAAEQQAQVRLLRDIWRPRPPLLEPAVLAWGGRAVVRTALGIYEEGAFADLPILADALEEAGCTESALLDHLRGPGPHVRGCWAVDLILGRS